MNLVGLRTLFYKEALRFLKVYLQTLVAPLVTAALYLVVFAQVLEEHVQVFPQISYTTFLIPGLIMMSIIQNAFANSSSSLIQSKISGNLIFVLVSPLANVEIYAAFVLAAMLRALLVGVGTGLIGMWFAPLPLHDGFYLAAICVVSSAACATLGVIAGIWAEKFDQVAGFTNFVVTPLSFLSGAFYSVHSLPAVWQTASHFNPFFYMIDGFRYGFLGHADADPLLSLAVAAMTWLVLAAATLLMLGKGYKLRA